MQYFSLQYFSLQILIVVLRLGNHRLYANRHIPQVLQARVALAKLGNGDRRRLKLVRGAHRAQISRVKHVVQHVVSQPNQGARN